MGTLMYLMWATRDRFCRNSLLQKVHFKGMWPWILLWLTSSNFRLKTALHSWQENELIEPWNLKCITCKIELYYPSARIKTDNTRCCFWAKDSPHSSQMKGLSPAWNLAWVTKCLFTGKVHPHSKQRKGFSLLCTCDLISNKELVIPNVK